MGEYSRDTPPWLRRLADPRITVAGLLWLAALTVWGTLAQANPAVGLHGATQRFFHSWVFRGPFGLPLPGMMGSCALLTIHLLASMAVRLRRRGAGLWLTHLGLLLMMLGAFFTRQSARETVVVLAEGEQTAVSVSETEWELAVIRPLPDGSRQITAHPFRGLRPDLVIALPAALGTVAIEQAWRSVDTTHLPARPAPENLRPAPVPADPRRALPAIVLRVADQRIALLGEGEALALGPPAGTEPATVYVQLRRARHPLPFTIRLLDFEKAFHPNTRLPRSFRSRVELLEDNRAREVVISMNRPLLHGPFAFYQSSYMDTPNGREISVLAVSENRFRPAPYLATALMAIGMVMHYLRPGRQAR
ncbi:MAG: cytochrome c biogenesis protein ResB [Kiritimatiellae bacterium]|nr:cytochrome c biogenesis protein ResB [Kiritimatiellia bacterium]